MKILFDEDIPNRLAGSFPVDKFQVVTARRMGWNGIRNGDLLQLAARESFAAVITRDRRMQSGLKQQPPPLAVFVLHSPMQKLADYAYLVSSCVIKELDAGVDKRFYSFSAGKS